jgi:hypothetical protein
MWTRLHRPQAEWRLPYSLAVLLGMVPLAGLVWLWDGHLAPASGVRDVYLSEGLRYDERNRVRSRDCQVEGERMLLMTSLLAQRLFGPGSRHPA